ncbi:MAG: hypothetical protein AAGA48_18290 [Myxococcota bacterium]
MLTTLPIFLMFAAASTWQVDGTSLAVVRGQEPVATHVRCSPNAGLHTLGVAVVAYSKKQGTTTWGHASLRVLYCRDGERFDAEYEMYRLSAWNELQLREEHEDEAFAASPWLTTQRGKLVLFRNADPVDAGWYGEAQAANREIYEVWLDLSPIEANAVVEHIDAQYAKQLQHLRTHTDLESRYVAWGDNCTAVFEALPSRVTDATGFPITPFAWVRRLHDAGVVRGRVLYPSHHLVKRWRSELPDTSRRLHPIFRRSARLSLPHVGKLHATWLNVEPAVVELLPKVRLQQETADLWYRPAMTSSASP